jgi:hypothetical protein
MIAFVRGLNKTGTDPPAHEPEPGRRSPVRGPVLIQILFGPVVADSVTWRRMPGKRHAGKGEKIEKGEEKREKRKGQAFFEELVKTPVTAC